jgi:hypothetical protein
MNANYQDFFIFFAVSGKPKAEFVYREHRGKNKIPTQPSLFSRKFGVNTCEY